MLWGFAIVRLLSHVSVIFWYNWTLEWIIFLRGQGGFLFLFFYSWIIVGIYFPQSTNSEQEIWRKQERCIWWKERVYFLKKKWTNGSLPSRTGFQMKIKWHFWRALNLRSNIRGRSLKKKMLLKYRNIWTWKFWAKFSQFLGSTSFEVKSIWLKHSQR